MRIIASNVLSLRRRLTGFLLAGSVMVLTVHGYPNRLPRISERALPSVYEFPVEGRPILYSKDEPHLSSRIIFPNTPGVKAVLIDSSRNGYGMIAGSTNPLYYHPDNGFILAYRQWMPDDPDSSGYLGVAFSTDGEYFEIYTRLNVLAPAEVRARYPSALGGNGYPYILWNEYAEGSGGGGYGGRPLFTWDELSYGGDLFHAPPVDINNGCGPILCNPPNNWSGSPSLAHDGNTPILNVVYSQWTDVRNMWLYHSNSHTSGHFTFNDAFLLFDGEDFQGNLMPSYTSPIDVNEDGIGYAAVTSYFGDYSPDSAHTFMIRKTTDYGETWSGEGGTGMNGTDYYFIPDSVLRTLFFDGGYLPESFIDRSVQPPKTIEFVSPFVGYNFELKVDENSGLHLFAAVLPADEGFIYPSADEGCGFYHFFSADPTDPSSWEVSFVTSMQKTFMFSYGNTGNWRRIFPSASLSAEDPNVMYVAYTEVTDPTATAFNYDVIVRRSNDLGSTWSDPANVTNTIMLGVDEIDAHLAPVSTDSSCFLVYQSPDYRTPTVSEQQVPEDYKNRIFFAEVSVSEFPQLRLDEKFVLPEGFRLSQNFPNPFNPVTTLEFSLPLNSRVSLTVYDILGREVETILDQHMNAGHHRVRWNAGDVPSGIYVVKMQAGNFLQTRKVMVLR